MTNSQLAAKYAEKGFIVIEKAIDSSDLEAIRGAAQVIIRDFDTDKHRSVFSTLHQDRDRDLYFIDSAEAVHCFLEEGALTDD